MAIKRTSKSAGTPVRKSSSSPGLRHVDVRTLQQMTPGESYLGWLCKNKTCGRIIAIVAAQAEPKAAADHSDDQLAAIKCPHCGDEDLYRWGARGEHQ
jgi:DNA-directed RNA polymerase subunit RPC12/RpoP